MKNYRFSTFKYCGMLIFSVRNGCKACRRMVSKLIKEHDRRTLLATYLYGVSNLFITIQIFSVWN